MLIYDNGCGQEDCIQEGLGGTIWLAPASEITRIQFSPHIL